MVNGEMTEYCGSSLLEAITSGHFGALLGTSRRNLRGRQLPTERSKGRQGARQSAKTLWKAEGAGTATSNPTRKRTKLQPKDESPPSRPAQGRRTTARRQGFSRIPTPGPSSTSSPRHGKPEPGPGGRICGPAGRDPQTVLTVVTSTSSSSPPASVPAGRHPGRPAVTVLAWPGSIRRWRGPAARQSGAGGQMPGRRIDERAPAPTVRTT
jgi:hypothetical protein